MRLVLVAVVSLVACCSAVQVVHPRGYHDAVGIPLAAKIKVQEEQMMARRMTAGVGSGRIIGGVLAPANAHPYFAGLLIDMTSQLGQSVCGASLLSPTRLVTAAHCWFDGFNQAWRFTVILGTPFLYWQGTRIMTSTVIMHPQWTTWNLRNDVAMIYLPQSVQLSTAIQPIQLPTGSDQSSTFVGLWANAVGFGKTSDGQAGASIELSHVNLQVISVAQCSAIYGANFVVDSTLCTNGAGRVGVCSGDSGGPLALQRNGQPVLIGISSFAASSQQSTLCEAGFPSGFARVTSFLDFIYQHLW